MNYCPETTCKQKTENFHEAANYKLNLEIKTQQKTGTIKRNKFDESSYQNMPTRNSSF